MAEFGKDNKAGKILKFEDIVNNIREAFDSLDVFEIAEVHNQICSAKVEYDGDFQWREVGSDI